MIEMLVTKVSEEDINHALEDLDDNRDGKVRDILESLITDTIIQDEILMYLPSQKD
jgi:hypothetical protein